MNEVGWQLELSRPAWLWGLVIVPLFWYTGRYSLTGFGPARRAISLLVRSVLVADLVLVLAGIRLIYPAGDQFVAAAIDRSASVGPQARRAIDAFLDEALQDAGGSRVVYLPFAGQWALAADRQGSENPRVAAGGLDPLDSSETNLAAAIEAACALVPAGYVPQVVLLSDGNQTVGDALYAARTAGALRIPISTVPLDPDADPEVAVSVIHLPAEAREGEAFSAEVVLHSNHEDEGIVELVSASKPTAQKRVHVARGENRVQISALASGSGKTEVSATIRGFQDRLAEDNSVAGSMLVRGRARVLVVATEPAAADPVAKALEEARVAVQRARPENLPGTPADWESLGVLVLCNVPAAAMPPAQMEMLRNYVAGGGGLIVIGGDQAFTAGGYHKTPLEEALPVVSIARKAERPTLAMVLVVDRSGSMDGEPLAMAKRAMQQAVDMLGPEDQIGVVAFNEKAHWASKLDRLTDKSRVLEEINSLKAEDGTAICPAIDMAYRALRDAPAGRKRMIVLTDGDSEEKEADFEGLATKAAAAQITMSTVALGEKAKPDLLRKLAQIGKGKFYACPKPADLPKTFQLETERATRPGISEKDTRPRVVGPAHFLDKVDVSRAPVLLGYVETVAKPASEAILVSEAGDPLLAWWRFGRGTSVAFTSDAQDRWAAKWLSWPGFKPFWVQLARQAVPPVDSTQQTFRAAYAEEFGVRGANRELLRKIAEITGGRYDPPPASILAPDGRTAPRAMPLWHYFLAAAAVILVLDVATGRW